MSLSHNLENRVKMSGFHSQLTNLIAWSITGAKILITLFVSLAFLLEALEAKLHHLMLRHLLTVFVTNQIPREQAFSLP
jgi:hypothetical protein